MFTLIYFPFYKAVLFIPCLRWLIESKNTMLKSLCFYSKKYTRAQALEAVFLVSFQSVILKGALILLLLYFLMWHDHIILDLWVSKCLTALYFCFFEERSDYGKLPQYSGWIRSKILQTGYSFTWEKKKKWEQDPNPGNWWSVKRCHTGMISIPKGETEKRGFQQYGTDLCTVKKLQKFYDLWLVTGPYISCDTHRLVKWGSGFAKTIRQLCKLCWKK